MAESVALQARRDHRGHILRMTTGRPMVTLKLAETADGFVAGGPHDPRLAITGAAANGMVHVLRAMHDAIMVGSGTVGADDPLMTVRLPGVSARPVRIVLDGDLALSPRSRLMLTATEAPVLLVAREDAQVPATLSGTEILRAPTGPDGRLDLAAMLAALGARGLTRILSEGGPRVAEQLLANGLVDEVLLFTAPRPFGGGDGVPGLAPETRAVLDRDFTMVEERAVGADRLRHYSREVRCSPVS